jgi:beta-lactamase regulating signal transducer with metallopeptidase domain
VHVVVNWLWQGVVLTFVADVAMRSTHRLSASTRYLVWWIAMALVLLLPVFAWIAAVSGVQPPVPSSGSSSLSPLQLPVVVPVWPLVAAVGCWIAWVLVALSRLRASAAALLRMRREAVPFPRAREARLLHWRVVQASGGRSARLMCSDRVTSASVLGLGPVMIAVSPTAARRLTDAELDQVLVHEWAHVQRWDDVARLVQIGIATVAGMHPAVWWIGRRIELEREIACDDYAVNVTGGAHSLARCLTKLAAVPHGQVSATLAPGMLLGSQLTVRVRRLLDPRRNTSTRGSQGVLGSAAAGLTLVAIVLSQLELVVTASAVEQRPSFAPVEAVQWPVAPSSRADDDTPIVSDVEPAASGSVGRLQARPEAARGGSPQTARHIADTTVSSRTTPASDTVDNTAPVDRLGSLAWQIPELPPTSQTLAPSAATASTGGPDDHVTGTNVATPWGAAADAGNSIGHGSQKAASATADAGTSVGRGSQKAAVATAGFFTRVSRKIAGSF